VRQWYFQKLHISVTKPSDRFFFRHLSSFSFLDGVCTGLDIKEKLKKRKLLQMVTFRLWLDYFDVLSQKISNLFLID
jgi:hypothetical protein